MAHFLQTDDSVSMRLNLGSQLLLNQLPSIPNIQVFWSTIVEIAWFFGKLRYQQIVRDNSDGHYRANILIGAVMIFDRDERVFICFLII